MLQYNFGCGLAKVDADAACDLMDGITGKVNRGWRNWIAVDTSLDSITEHPRFQALCAALDARLSASE